LADRCHLPSTRAPHPVPLIPSHAESGEAKYLFSIVSS
jgi:hypothetical protein